MSFRGDIDPRGINSGVASNTSANILPRYPTLTPAPYYPYINRIEGDGQLQLNTLTYNGGYDVSPDTQIYSFGSIGAKDGRHIQNVRLPNVSIGPQGQIPFPAGFSPTIPVPRDRLRRHGRRQGRRPGHHLGPRLDLWPQLLAGLCDRLVQRRALRRDRRLADRLPPRRPDEHPMDQHPGPDAPLQRGLR
ncbi:MAG: hypothetical protein WDN45_15980 [Caulobacteraceae bacterium]